MAKYRILSLDGGGIRGVYTARILSRLEQAKPGFLATINLFAGTSTGGIIALGLASGLTPDDLVALYSNNGKKIFDDSWWDDVVDAGGLTGADYDNRNLKRILTNLFGGTKLKDLSPKRVLIPSFDLDNSDLTEHSPGDVRTWKPKFFHNYPGADSDGDQAIVDVAMRTSAAPTFFPTYDGHIDGGVVANNPSVAALAQALDGSTGKQSLGDVRILSIGTGENPSFVAGKNLDWGYAHWAKPLVSLMIDGVMGVSDYQCRRILGDRYMRVTSILPKQMKLDDVKNIPDLLAAADGVAIQNVVNWLGSKFI